MKELDLVFNFKNAPEDLKIAAQAQYDIQKKLVKNQESLKALKLEVNKNQAEYEEKLVVFKELLKAWDTSKEAKVN